MRRQSSQFRALHHFRRSLPKLDLLRIRRTMYHRLLLEVGGLCAAEEVAAVGHYLLGGVLVGGVEGVL